MGIIKRRIVNGWLFGMCIPMLRFDLMCICTYPYWVIFSTRDIFEHLLRWSDWSRCHKHIDHQSVLGRPTQEYHLSLSPSRDGYPRRSHRSGRRHRGLNSSYRIVYSGNPWKSWIISNFGWIVLWSQFYWDKRKDTRRKGEGVSRFERALQWVRNLDLFRGYFWEGLWRLMICCVRICVRKTFQNLTKYGKSAKIGKNEIQWFR